MVNANTIDISEYQDPSKFDYQAAKQAGIQTIIIRASTDLRQDKHVKEHIANAQKYGFNWHLYHYWYNDSGEAEFAVKNAEELGLGANQYLFLDMEDKSLPTNWNEQFAEFRRAVGAKFKVGLYCSDSPYKAKFQDSQLQNLKVARWVASYSYEPKNYDIWQMSGSGSGGFGSYTNDVDRNYDKSGILVLPTSPNQPVAPVQQEYQQIVLEWGKDTAEGYYGRGYSPDNGQTFVVTDTSFGRKFRQEDADRLKPFLDKYYNGYSSGTSTIAWNNITGKPNIPEVSVDTNNHTITVNGNTINFPNSVDLSNYYTKGEVDNRITTAVTNGKVDLTDYVKQAQLTDYVKVDSVNSLSSEVATLATKEDVNKADKAVEYKINQVQSIKSGALADLKGGKYEADFVASDAPVSAEGMVNVDSGEKYTVQTYTVMQNDSSVNSSDSASADSADSSSDNSSDSASADSADSSSDSSASAQPAVPAYRVGDQYTRVYADSVWSDWHKATHWS